MCIFPRLFVHNTSCRRHLKITTSRAPSSTRQTFPTAFDDAEFLSDALDPSLSAAVFFKECHLICVHASRPLWLLRCITIFASPNPFVLFLRCLHHALNNRFNEAASACVGFVKAVEKLKSDPRAHATGESVACVRGLLILGADAMILMACRIADDILATGVSAWWRDRWCQVCESSFLPCKAAASAPILRALHQHGLRLRILADSISAELKEEMPHPQPQLETYEHWLHGLKAPIASDDASVQEIIRRLTETLDGHKTAHIILAHLQSDWPQLAQESRDGHHHITYRHQHTVIDSEVNAHWQEKIRSPSWGCSPEFRMACVERCRHLLLQAQIPASPASPSSASTADSVDSIAQVASRFFFSVLKQLVHTPPAGTRCTRTERRVLDSYCMAMREAAAAAGGAAWSPHPCIASLLYIVKYADLSGCPCPPDVVDALHQAALSSQTMPSQVSASAECNLGKEGMRYVQEILDFLLKGPWRIYDLHKDSSRPATNYLTAKDTLLQAEHILSPFSDGGGVMKILRACQSVLCYVLDPLNDSVLFRFPDLAANMLQLLEDARPDFNSKFMQSLRTAVAMASAIQNPHSSSSATSTSTRMPADQDPESPVFSQTSVIAASQSGSTSPHSKPRRRKGGALDEQMLLALGDAAATVLQLAQIGQIFSGGAAVFVQRCALLARVCEMLKSIPDENGKERPAVIERCERMPRSIMLQRLLSLGPSHFPLAAEAIDLLGIEQHEAELCVANCFTVSVLHYAINIDAPSAPRSPAKGRMSFARVDLNTSTGGGVVDKQDILAPSLLLRPDTSAASLLAQWDIGATCHPFSMYSPLSSQVMNQIARLVKRPSNMGNIILRRLERFTPSIFSELHIDAELIMLACVCFELSSDSSAASQLKNLFVLKRIDVYISHKSFDLLGRVWSCAVTCRFILFADI